MDDVIYMSTSLEMMNEFRDEMQRTFEMSDLGLMSYFLVMEIKQDMFGIHILQEKICRRFIEELQYEQLQAFYHTYKSLFKIEFI